MEYRSKLVEREQQITDIVTPRMRKVLQSWFPQGMNGTEMLNFWRKHGVMAIGEDESIPDGVFLVKTMALSSYGGAENIANVSVKTMVFT